MSFVITKEFHFSASHILNGLAEGHPCGRMHGHNYVIKVELESNHLDKRSFVQDYGELKDIKYWIDNNLDHRHLNNIIPKQPSAENIALFLYTRFKPMYPLLKAVEVSETPKTNCRYEQTNN